MKEVGEKLRSRREELGYTIDEMSVRTKIQPQVLHALEAGDLDYFKDDLSYLRYYLRFYCQALQIDFEEIRGEFENIMDDFHQTEALRKIQDREEKQKSINQRIQDSKKGARPEKRRIDYSLLSLILVVGILVIAGGFFLAKMIPQWLNRSQNDPVLSSTPYVEPSMSAEPSPTIEVVPTPEISTLSITTTDGYHYEVRGWKPQEQISIRIEFGTETWMRVSFNGEVTDNPVSKTYQPSETMEILKEAEEDLDIGIHFGILEGNTLYFNGVLTPLDERVSHLTRGQQLHFVLKGD